MTHLNPYPGLLAQIAADKEPDDYIVPLDPMEELQCDSCQ